MTDEVPAIWHTKAGQRPTSYSTEDSRYSHPPIQPLSYGLPTIWHLGLSKLTLKLYTLALSTGRASYPDLSVPDFGWPLQDTPDTIFFSMSRMQYILPSSDTGNTV